MAPFFGVGVAEAAFATVLLVVPLAELVEVVAFGRVATNGTLTAAACKHVSEHHTRMTLMYTEALRSGSRQ